MPKRTRTFATAAAKIVVGSAFALACLTAAWPTWIESVFGVAPDAGTGAVEWIAVGVVFLVTVTVFGHRMQSRAKLETDGT